MSPMYKMLASCYLAYMLGIYVRKAERFIRYDLVTAVFSLVLLYLLNPVGYVSLNIGQIQSLGFFIVCSLLGWLLLRSAAEVLSGAIASFLAYAGRYSMSILIHLKLKWMVNAKSPFIKLIFPVISVLIFQTLSRKNQTFLSYFPWNYDQPNCQE